MTPTALEGGISISFICNIVGDIKDHCIGNIRRLLRLVEVTSFLKGTARPFLRSFVRGALEPPVRDSHIALIWILVGHSCIRTIS